MKRKRREFSRAYKLDVVKKVLIRGLSYCGVARDLRIEMLFDPTIFRIHLMRVANSERKIIGVAC